MFVAVKPPGRSLAATSVAGPSPSRLFHICDYTTGTRFLVDTGSEVCVIPPSTFERKRTYDKLTLTAVNGAPIPTFG